jgi:hypothetical protein
VSALLAPNPVCGTEVVTIAEALDLPNFNAMYQADINRTSAKNCKDEVFREAWRRAIVHDFIKCGGGEKIDYNFFMDMFGFTPQKVDAKEVSNLFMCETDLNVYFEGDVTAGAPGGQFTVRLLKGNHSWNGKASYPAKGWSIVDKENNIWYSIEDKATTTDFGHTLTLQPMNGTVVGAIKKNKKYLVVPVRFVGGYSCPMPTNKMPQVGYMQSVKPFRLRRDWSVKVELLSGYRDILAWTILFDQDGNEIDAWDVYEAQAARQDLQLALNILAFLATPITNEDLISGTGVTSVDDIHTGFYGYLPSIKYAGGNIMDFDPASGFDLDANLEPFILQNDALKKGKRFVITHGKSFGARLTSKANKLVKNEGLGVNIFPAFQRNGDTLKKLSITGYEWLGYSFATKEWGALNDSRFMGSQYFDNLAIMTPLDGVTDKNNRPIPAIEFYQYGRNGETGDFYESIVDKRKTTGCEEIFGYVAQSIMMAVHCPNQHTLFNPVTGC